MGKWTEGEWFADQITPDDYAIIANAGNDSEGAIGAIPVAETYSFADADLIAAAPDLYEHLNDFVAQYGCNCGHPSCKRCHETKEAKSALAKARGGA